MRYGIVMSNLDDYADPRLAIRLAQAAEEAGWEAFFVWDHLGFVWGSASSDPWITLSAVAVSTTHLKLGTAITPLARRRPQVVANTLGSLDLLSGGRMIFGTGLGGGRGGLPPSVRRALRRSVLECSMRGSRFWTGSCRARW